MFALVRQKVTGERRKFNNKQLHNLNSTIIRQIGRSHSMHGDVQN
jgi:hypothetical protein